MLVLRITIIGPSIKWASNLHFLNGPLEEEVCIEQTPGFVVRNQELKFYKLKKELYDLKEAPRAWNKRIYGFLKEVGFKKCVSEHGMYANTDTSEGVIILCLYVDNGQQHKVNFYVQE